MTYFNLETSRSATVIYNVLYKGHSTIEAQTEKGYNEWYRRGMPSIPHPATVTLPDLALLFAGNVNADTSLPKQFTVYAVSIFVDSIFR